MYCLYLLISIITYKSELLVKLFPLQHHLENTSKKSKYLSLHPFKRVHHQAGGICHHQKFHTDLKEMYVIL